MNLHINKLQLFQEVQRELNRQYPFLKLEFLHPLDHSWVNGLPKDNDPQHVADLLAREIGLDDDMTVTELENALQDWFGTPVRVMRKSGNVWIDTCHTGNWHLRKQNDQGREISAEYR